MTTTLTYGSAATCLLDSAEVTTLSPRQQTPLLSTDEIAAAVRTQLGSPLDYPPLSQATIPGDRVVLAVDREVPQLLSVLDGTLLALRDAGVEAALTTIVFADAAADLETIDAGLSICGHAECQLKIHDPDNEKERALLGVTRMGEPLRLNRELCDADFVLPITVARGQLRESEAASGFTGLFPAFSDRETIERFSAVAREQETDVASGVTHAEKLNEAEECGQLLGAGMLLQVVPGVGDEIVSVFAGVPVLVTQQAQASYRQTWCCTAELRAALVIVTIPGGPEQQTWQNVGRALAAAAMVVEEDGAIVVCSELTDLPGRALGHLAGNEEEFLVVEREILRTPSADCAAAWQLCRALQRGAVYLRSQLRAQVVESLGVTPLESDSEIERLALSLRPCLVLEAAHKLLPAVDESL